MFALFQKQVSIDGTLVNYYSGVDDIGKAKKIFIFLHGWRSDGTIWFDVAEKMVDIIPYCVDLPGFGKSPAPNKAFSLEDYAHLVRRFIEKLELKNVALVGHSFGGRVAIKLVSTNPGLVEKLVLVDSAGFVAPSVKKTVLKAIAKSVKPFFKPVFMQPLRRKIYSTMGAEDYITTPELKQTFIKVVNEDLSDAMRSIVTPTILVWGEKDKETPLGVGQKMHALIPKSSLKVIKGAGHFSFLDQPLLFIKFLKST